MRNANLSDTDLVAYSGEHLLYELQFLWFTANELRRFTKPEPMVSVLIESFGIHLRNLIDFFCTPAGKERDDDVIAPDFCPGWNENLSNSLKAARDRANKELSHLTLGRKSGQDPTKPWDTNELFKEVSDIARRFVAQAPPTRLSPEVMKWVQMVHRPSVAMGGAVIANNSTATMTMTVTRFNDDDFWSGYRRKG